MKRVQDIAWPVIGLGAVAVSAWLLFRELRGLSMASLAAAFGSISPLRWALAWASTALAYAALAWYDRIALLHLGRRIGWPFVALTSFVTYAIAHNVGASVLSGAVIRYRAYSTKGLAMGEVGLLVAFCSFTFGLGAVTLGGLLLLIRPDVIERFDGAPDWVGQAAGAVLIAAPTLYLLGSLLHFPAVRIAGYELTYPRPPIAVRQLLAGPLELIGAAGIIFFALPAGNPGFVVVLAVFLASFCLALVSHAPGGLGVLEIAFLSGMPDAPQANVVAALLVFRLLYLIIPLAFSLVVVLVFERRRWRALVPLGAKTVHAGDDRTRR
ncbi:lysylphosphatidylglycerol synthase transmembrane domain-containing protein [Roseiarcus fermentans]|nr:YbhN family protein [Roseiarcus fermentans]